MQQEASNETGAAETSPPPVPGPISPGGEDIAASGPGAPGEPEAPSTDPAAAEATPEEQLGEWKDAAIRATADLDNFRKRMAREKSELMRYASQSLLEELLPVLDNFEMGLQAAAAEQDSMIFRGMEMVKKQLDDFLRSQGVVEIPAEPGHPFDLSTHEAVSQEESADAEEGTVVRVLRRGFKLHDRLLRPANVVVAKGPDEAEGESEGGEQD